MSPTCSEPDCTNEVRNKNAAGHYREKCWDCIEAVAAEVEPAGEIEIDPDEIRGGRR